MDSTYLSYLTELSWLICKFKRFGYQEDYFGFETVDLYVWRVVFWLKLDVWTSLERSSAQVMQKVLKMMAKWSPRGAFGSTLGTQNDPKVHKTSVFCINISHTDFWGPPGPHCGRNLLKITCQKQCLDCAGASGSHVDRFPKNSPWDHIFEGFWRHFGCQIEVLWGFWGRRWHFFSALGAKSLSGLWNRRAAAQNHIAAEVKVYLSG